MVGKEKKDKDKKSDDPFEEEKKSYSKTSRVISRDNHQIHLVRNNGVNNFDIKKPRINILDV